MVNEKKKFGEIYELHRNQSRGFAMGRNWIIRMRSKIVVGKAEDEDSFVSAEKSWHELHIGRSDEEDFDVNLKTKYYSNFK
ncbi:hypothetical protein V1478_011160 [Vespula squamosa]|uniref:Uncharacterized protein n=1 Tax=Vespula squamosa TaxID=30214 RepID=A0ABD2ADQ3_VESSQ